MIMTVSPEAGRFPSGKKKSLMTKTLTIKFTTGPIRVVSLRRPNYFCRSIFNNFFLIIAVTLSHPNFKNLPLNVSIKPGNPQDCKTPRTTSSAILSRVLKVVASAGKSRDVRTRLPPYIYYVNLNNVV